jgi:hypothetical protein
MNPIDSSFIEKRELTLSEYQLVLLLEDMESHGIKGEFLGYYIDIIHLGKRGSFRVLCKGNQKILVGKRYPPRTRKNTNDKEEFLYYYFFYQ